MQNTKYFMKMKYFKAFSKLTGGFYIGVDTFPHQIDPLRVENVFKFHGTIGLELLNFFY